MQNRIEDHKMTFKCRKCRHLLFSNNEICDSHGNPLEYNKNKPQICNPPTDVWYLREDLIPFWIKDQVDNSNWTKGKLYCGTCKSRIGSFDFISGSKCYCGSSVLPALHVVSSKVDCQAVNSPLSSSA